MAVLNPGYGALVDGRQIHWEKNCGTAEISDFGKNFHFDRVYDDALDMGVTVVGHREEVIFVVVDTHYDTERDLTFWSLKSINKKTGRVDNRFELTIFND